MAEYRVANVTTSNVQLHTTDVSFDVERSDDERVTWRVIGSDTIEKMKNYIVSVNMMQAIHSRADAIAHRDAMLTDTIEGAKDLLSERTIGPKALVAKEPEPLEL